MNNPEVYIKRCLQLANLGAGSVAPNPMVGAVLEYNNEIIGEGFHQKYGEPHAEVNCINSVSKKNKKYISESTLYVSLEPCVHFGKTPPCVDLIIKNKIPHVVISCKDVFESVNGKGVQKLQDAGINVMVGILQTEAIELNKRFFTFQQQQRPYIILKWAQSSNGKIAKADFSSILISNKFSNVLVHKWRSEEAAILVGTNTALYDNPALTTRHWYGKSPVRLVIDMDMKLPISLNLFDNSATTIVFNTLKHLPEKNVFYYKIDKQNIIPQIFHALYLLEIQSVIVEGGTKLLQSFINNGLWDEARIISNSSLVIDNGINAPILTSALLIKEDNYLSDTIKYYKHIKHG